MRIPKLTWFGWCGLAGAALLFIWAAMVLVFAAPALACWVTGLAGLGLAGAWGWQERVWLQRILLSPGMRYGSNALAFTAGVVGIVVFINVITTRHSFRGDLTANRFYSLSDQTVKVLKGLKQKVKVTAFFKGGDPMTAQLKDLLEEYRHISKNLEFEFIDPDKTPARAQIYKINAYNTTVIETGEGKRKDIQPQEIFGYQFTGGREPQREFKGETALTSAILSVTVESKENIYFLEGHGEHSIDDAGENGMAEMRRALEGDNYEVKALNLMKSGKIPEDASLVVLAGPRGSVSTGEQKVLRSWMARGGRMIIMLDPESAGGMENLLGDWGITLLNGVVVDPRSFYFVDPLTPIPSYGDHPVTADLAKQRVGVLFPGARALELGKVRGATVTPLLRTTPESWLETDMSSKQPKFDRRTDRKGPLIIGAAVSAESKAPVTVTPGEQAPPGAGTPKLVVFADSDFATNRIKAVSDGNFDILLNSAGWLLGSTASVSIRPKQADQRRVFLTNVQTSLLWYLTVLLTPLAVIGAGAWRWWRRRSL